MPTTAAGTTYTLHVWTNELDDQCQWSIADNLLADPAPKPLLLFCHGAGGEYNFFSQSNGIRPLRELIIDNGWAWVESYATGNHWGSEAACLSYAATVREVARMHPFGPMIIMGRSMGGLPAHTLATQERFGLREHTAGVVFNSPVQSIVWWAVTAGKSGPNLIYGDPKADLDAFLAASQPYDPLRADPALYAEMPVLWCAGTNDVTTPIEANTWPQYDRVRPHALVSRLAVKGGGDHGQTETGTYDMVDAMWPFMQQAVGQHRSQTGPHLVVTDAGPRPILDMALVGPDGPARTTMSIPHGPQWRYPQAVS